MSTKQKGSRISNYQKEDYDDYRAAYDNSSYQGEYTQDRGNASQQSGYADGGSIHPGSRSGEPESARQRRSVRKTESLSRQWQRPWDDGEEE